MLKLKMITIALMFFAATSTCLAVTSDSVPPGPSEPQKKILKVTAVVKKIEAHILYLESGETYSLRSVRVDYSHYKAQPTSPGKRRIADLFFVNGALKEVTIH